MTHAQHLEDLGKQKAQQLQHRHDEDVSDRYALVHEIDEAIIALEKRGQSISKRQKSTPHDDESTQYLQSHIEAILRDMKSERQALMHYSERLSDSKYIVISNWSMNDLSDSNNDLINDSNLATWRTNGCKIYGKCGGNKSLNSYGNKGYFASFNYPVNIVKAPNIYFYDKDELKGLYSDIKAHNPTLGQYLVAMAKAGTIPVLKFKQLFGLTATQLKAKLAKERAAAQHGVPNPSIQKLQNYYQWELRQRKNYDLDESDLSGYDSDYQNQSDFSDMEKGYRENGNQDYDIGSDIDDPNHYEDETDSDFFAGMGYDDTQSDLDDSDVDMNQDEVDPFDTDYHGE